MRPRYIYTTISLTLRVGISLPVATFNYDRPNWLAGHSVTALYVGVNFSNSPIRNANAEIRACRAWI
jgi:hypothetical protein